MCSIIHTLTFTGGSERHQSAVHLSVHILHDVTDIHWSTASRLANNVKYSANPAHTD